MISNNLTSLGELAFPKTDGADQRAAETVAAYDLPAAIRIACFFLAGEGRASSKKRLREQ